MQPPPGGRWPRVLSSAFSSFRLDTQPAQAGAGGVKGEAAQRAAEPPLDPPAPVERIRESRRD
jgi:hypothetical protein